MTPGRKIVPLDELYPDQPVANWTAQRDALRALAKSRRDEAVQLDEDAINRVARV